MFIPSTFSPDVALALLRALNAELPFLDAILATGDLATTGTRSDLKLARNFFQGDVPVEWNPRKAGLPSLLSDDNYLLLSLPGNHDRYQGKFMQPTSQEFECHFGTFWDFDRKAPFSALGIGCASTGQSERVRVATIELDGAVLGILVVDFSLENAHSGEGHKGYVGQGRVASKILGELKGATRSLQAEAQQSGQAIGCIWAVHFPPGFPSIPDSLELLDSQHLIDAAISSGVSLILAGHTHETVMYKVSTNADEEVQVICSGPSSGISSHENYSFSVLDIEVTSQKMTTTPTMYSWEHEKFVKQPKFPTEQDRR